MLKDKCSWRIKTSIMSLISLIIFMVTTPMMNNSIKVTLPKGQAEESSDGEPAVSWLQAGGNGGIVREGFVQESNFYYLTGVSEPGAALILAPGEHRFNEILIS